MKRYTGVWGFEEAAHLARRLGFGNPPVAEVERLRRLGMELAIEQLMRSSQDAATVANPFDLTAAFQQAIDNNVNNPAARTIGAAQAWWLHHMLTTPEPFTEKLTLFWHGHFATGLDKVRNGFMLKQQNELFRNHGLGSFQRLVLLVSQNPAMLRYLDNDENVKKPQRELRPRTDGIVHHGGTRRLYRARCPRGSPGFYRLDGGPPQKS
jgi:uncharacterized protein (DUF1800 family)